MTLLKYSLKNKAPSIKLKQSFKFRYTVFNLLKSKNVKMCLFKKINIRKSFINPNN